MLKGKQVLSSQHQTQKEEVDGYRKKSRPEEEDRCKETGKEDRSKEIGLLPLRA
ncbi:MAG: hypothetical protein QY316_04355 [Thermodesulfobacteriota bacterium]|nr:MAG: hypothetical protein QY316_04355 [Thermodesulfobacteriota bacterium]